MFDNIMQWLMGNGMQGMTPGASPTPTPMPQPQGNPMPGQYGPAAPAYAQNMSPTPGANPAQGQDLRQQLIMKMLQQGMMGQGQGQGQQAPQVPPMAMGMGSGRPMAPAGGVGAAASLAQGMRPGMMPRRPLGMF